MIHSVKDFVDKKMNNKLICFNNVSDDYLFFYDIKKDSFCATKRNKKHIEDDHVFLYDYKSIKEKIYFKDRNIIDDLYNKIIRNEIHSFQVSFRIVHENQMEWYECQGNKIDQKEIVLGTIYEKNWEQSAFNDGSVCCYIWTKYDNFCKITKSCKTVWIRNHGAVYSNSDRNIYDSKKYGTRSEIP